MTINTKVILATFQSDLFQNVMKAVTSLKLAMRMEMMEVSLKVLEAMMIVIAMRMEMMEISLKVLKATMIVIVEMVPMILMRDYTYVPDPYDIYAPRWGIDLNMKNFPNCKGSHCHKLQ